MFEKQNFTIENKSYCIKIKKLYRYRNHPNLLMKYENQRVIMSLIVLINRILFTCNIQIRNELIWPFKI